MPMSAADDDDDMASGSEHNTEQPYGAGGDGDEPGTGTGEFPFFFCLALFSSHFFFQIFMCFYRSFAPLYLRLIFFFSLSWDLLPGSQSSYFPTLRTGKLENSNRISICRMKWNGRVGVNDKRHAPCSDDAIAQLGRDAQAADECIHDLRAQTEAAGLCGEPDDADGRD